MADGWRTRNAGNAAGVWSADCEFLGKSGSRGLPKRLLTQRTQRAQRKSSRKQGLSRHILSHVFHLSFSELSALCVLRVKCLLRSKGKDGCPAKPNHHRSVCVRHCSQFVTGREWHGLADAWNPFIEFDAFSTPPYLAFPAVLRDPSRKAAEHSLCI